MNVDNASHKQRPTASLFASEQLLLGIMAFQLSLVTREQFLAGFDSWIRNKNQPMSEILQQHKAISTDQREILERLVQMFLAKHEGDVEKSLASVSSVPCLHSELTRIDDPDINASLVHVGAGHPDELKTVLQPVDSFGRFRILRPHARGGLGQVSVALDQEIHREVALKEILPDHLDQSSRERFVLEAEITGGLEHPGIVPVYAFGHTPDGRPYYAMRFVQGESLKHAIDQYHESKKTELKKSGDGLLALRQLLGRFIDVCNTIEYAHSRGVLHRDLKPSNIMIGKYGETLVVDWGLAKVIGKGEIISHEQSLRPTSSLSSSGQTQPGSAIGTPAYMSPEHSAGRLADLGPATDVYSLGATLYHLLAGKPPFVGSTIEIIPRVQTGEFPRPMQVSSTVPHRLEAICLKAMRLNPSDRYASPRNLADDLEHWMADEPVSVVRESFFDKMSRVSRKHRGIVTTVLAALVLLTFASTIAAVVFNTLVHTARRERDRANHERLESEAQRRLAEERAITARKNQYLANMTLALQSMGRLELSVVLDRLLADIPSTGLPDVRGFTWYYLWNKCHREQLTIHAHQTGVSCVAFSPNQRTLATGGKEGAIKIWRLTEGFHEIPLEGHREEVNSIVFSPDGRSLASASDDRSVKLWSVETSQLLGQFLGHQGNVNGVAFSPDGKKLCAVGSDAKIRLWDVNSKDLVAILEGHTDGISKVRFSPNGELLASCSDDGTIRVWDTTIPAEISKFQGHTGHVNCIDFSPDGNLLASGGRDLTIKLWSVAERVEIASFSAHSARIRSVAFSPDGAALVSVSEDKTIKVWDVPNCRIVSSICGHTRAIRDVTFVPGGKSIVTCAEDGNVKLWTMPDPTRTILTGHNHGAYAVAFSPDSNVLASGDWDYSVRLWDVSSGQKLATLNADRVTLSVAFSPDGAILATSGSGDMHIRLWDVERREIRSWLRGHTGPVQKVLFSPDGRRLASCGDDLTIKIWDFASGEELASMKGHMAPIDSLAFTPDGTQLASGSRDTTVRIWDALRFRELHTFDVNDGMIRSLSISPDGKTLAIGGQSGTTLLWDFQTHRLKTKLIGHQKHIESIAFSRDGAFLATSSVDTTAKIWDVTTGLEVDTLLGHTDFIRGIALAPNNQKLATASADSTVRIWDIPISTSAAPP